MTYFAKRMTVEEAVRKFVPRAPCTKCGGTDLEAVVEELFLPSRGGYIRHQGWKCRACGRVRLLKEVERG